MPSSNTSSGTAAPNDNDYIEPPPKKKAKLAKAVNKRYIKKTTLPIFINLPLDVLYEIFCLVRPLDLLRLSRTSKALRNTLMRRSAAFVWKSSLEQVPDLRLPPCPEDLSHPQYIKLACDSFCFACNKRTSKVLWELRVRICEDCASTRVVDYFAGHHMDLHPDTFRMLPSYSGNSRKMRGELYWKESLQPMSDKLKKLDLDAEQGGEAGSKIRAETRAKMEDRKIYIHINARLCRQWAASIDQEHKRQLEGRRDDRYRQIRQKLLECGWTERELCDLYSIKGVNHAKTLTEKGWLKMLPKLEEELRQQKILRMELQRPSLLRMRKDVISKVYGIFQQSRPEIPICYWPNIDILEDLEPFKSAIEAHTEEVDHESLEALADELPTFIEERNKQESQPLLKILSEETDYLDDADAHRDASSIPLERVDSLFTCSDCKAIALYPQINHRCLEKLPNSYIFLLPIKPKKGWTTKSLEFNHRGSAAAKSLATLLLANYENYTNPVTALKLQLADPRVVCLHCPDEDKGRVTMAWMDALYHWIKSHTDCSEPEWEMLSKEESAQIVLLEEEDGGSARWVCRICRVCWTSIHLKSMREHIRDRHNQEPIVDYNFSSSNSARIQTVRLCMPGSEDDDDTTSSSDLQCQDKITPSKREDGRVLKLERQPINHGFLHGLLGDIVDGGIFDDDMAYNSHYYDEEDDYDDPYVVY